MNAIILATIVHIFSRLKSMELVGHLVRDRAVQDREQSLQLLRLLPQLLLLVEDGGHERLDEDPLLLTLLGGDHVKNWL